MCKCVFASIHVLGICRDEKRLCLRLQRCQVIVGPSNLHRASICQNGSWCSRSLETSPEESMLYLFSLFSLLCLMIKMSKNKRLCQQPLQVELSSSIPQPCFLNDNFVCNRDSVLHTKLPFSSTLIGWLYTMSECRRSVWKQSCVYCSIRLMQSLDLAKCAMLVTLHVSFFFSK